MNATCELRSSKQMRFADAIVQFEEFLQDQGHIGPLVWIEPSDLIWFGSTLLIRPQAESAKVSERVFNEADNRGYGVSLEAIARLGPGLCCLVFAPENAEEATTHLLGPSITMKIRQDLRAAKRPNRFRWWLARRMESKGAQLRARQFLGNDYA
jgi:hypothetical protein